MKDTSPSAPVAFSYTRLSSGTQLSGGGMDRQEAAARSWSERHGHQLDDTLDLSDAGVSAFRGRNLERGALGRFLGLAEASQLGPAPVLLIEAVDRLSRSEPLEALSDTFIALARAGVRIIDLEDGQEYSRQTLNRDSLALVKLALKVQAAHDYSARLSRRISAHWEQGRERGRRGQVVRGAGGLRPFWLELDADGCWALNDHATTVRTAFDLAETIGCNRIATELNRRGMLTSTGKKWWASSVADLLHNPATHGALVFGQKAHDAGKAKLKRWEADAIRQGPRGEPPSVPPVEVIADYFPAVVERATFDLVQRRAQERATDNSAKAKDGPMRSWLQGLASCQHGGGMAVNSRGPYQYLRCRPRRYRGGCGCNGYGWKLHQIHAHVLGRFPRLTETLIAAGQQPREGERQQLQQQLERAQQQLRQVRSALRKAEKALAAAVDQEATVTLLERLNANVDTKQQEVHQAEADVTDIQQQIAEEQRRPDPGVLLGGDEVRSLVKAMATGDSTPEQRKKLNALLRQINLLVVLDDSRKEAPMVGIKLGESHVMWMPFQWDLEVLILRDLFPPPVQRGRAQVVESDGGRMIVGR